MAEVVSDELLLRTMAARMAEERLGRALTAGELHLDIIGYGRDLDTAKDELAAAIQAELRRAIRAQLTGRGDPELRITPAMEQVLLGLHETGRRHARREMESMGVRSFADEDDEPGSQFQGIKNVIDRVNRARAAGRDVPEALERIFPFLTRLGSQLREIGLRMRKEAVGFELGEQAQARLAEILERKIPGALDAAGRLVSGTLTSGLAAEWENVPGIKTWVYSAVMDGNTCQPCGDLDGWEFDTLEEAYQYLPNFGPNPLCFGDGRCRCRLVPGYPTTTGWPEPPVPPREPEAVKLSDLVEVKESRGDIYLHGDRLEKAADSAVADIEKAIGGPLVWDSPTEPLDISWANRDSVMSLNAIAHFLYKFDKSRRPLVEAHRERFSKRGPVGGAADLIHEIGHYLDVVYFGRGKNRGTSYGGSMLHVYHQPLFQAEGITPRASNELRDLMELLTNTPTYELAKRLYYGQGSSDSAMDDKVIGEYLLRPREMFARAFTQYVAYSAEDPELLNSVQAAYKMHHDIGVPWYWSDEEFFDIIVAFDKLFAKARELPSTA